MKTGIFTPKPGDLFRWFHLGKMGPCDEYHYMWSNSMNKAVHLNSGNLLLLISITKDKISWLDGDKFVHAKVEDTDRGPSVEKHAKVHPRKYEI